MMNTLSTLVLVLGIAATGCSKKQDAPAADKPATGTEAAKPTENKAAETKPTEAPKAEEAKAAPAETPTTAGGGAVTFASDDEYVAEGKAAIGKVLEVFTTAGTDCAKLASGLNKLAADPKIMASSAYQKAHPEVKSKFEAAAKAEMEKFATAAMPAIEACATDNAVMEALKKLGE